MARIDPVTAALSASDTWSNPIFLAGGFNFSLWGTFAATVTLQRSFDNGATWLDVVTYTGPKEGWDMEPEGCLYRFGVKAGAYTSGTVNGRLGQ